MLGWAPRWHKNKSHTLSCRYCFFHTISLARLIKWTVCKTRRSTVVMMQNTRHKALDQRIQTRLLPHSPFISASVFALSFGCMKPQNQESMKKIKSGCQPPFSPSCTHIVRMKQQVLAHVSNFSFTTFGCCKVVPPTNSKPANWTVRTRSVSLFFILEKINQLQNVFTILSSQVQLQRRKSRRSKRSNTSSKQTKKDGGFKKA